jgi:hypothetical protein
MDLVIQSALVTSTAAMRRAANRCEQQQSRAAVHLPSDLRYLNDHPTLHGISQKMLTTHLEPDLRAIR